jgi:hypothetical protein
LTSVVHFIPVKIFEELPTGVQVWKKSSGDGNFRFVANILQMPDIAVGAQIFDVVFHPVQSLVYTGLLTGEVKAFGYDEQGQHHHKFTLKPSKKSCRGLTIDEDGNVLWAVGKAKTLQYVSIRSISHLMIPKPLCDQLDRCWVRKRY